MVCSYCVDKELHDDVADVQNKKKVPSSLAFGKLQQVVAQDGVVQAFLMGCHSLLIQRNCTREIIII